MKLMLSKTQILKAIKSKGKGKYIHVKTFEYAYWGRLCSYTDKILVLTPYYTNKEKRLPIHNHPKELQIDEIIDID